MAQTAVKKLKLMTILGTRPEIIRLSEVIKKADVDSRFNFRSIPHYRIKKSA